MACLLFVVSALAVSAQDFSSIGISEVVRIADARLQVGDYAGAIPALREAIARTRELSDPAGRETAQTCRFQLARALYRTGDSAAGMKVLDEYMGLEPRAQERMALRMMGQGFFETKQWDKVEDVANRLLSAGGLAADDKYMANLLIGQARFQLGKWKECLDPLTFAARNAKDERTKSVTQIMIVRALVEDGNWRELFGRLPRIYRTDSKYDIALNLTIMQAGKAQFEADSYLNALLLYRMVLPREDLIGFANKRIATLSARLKSGVKQGDDEDIQGEIDGINESIKTLQDLPAYEDEVTFRIGQIYAEVKRYWEGYVLFDSLYLKDRNSDIGEAAILQSVLVLYDLKETARAEERIIQYLNEKPNGQFARTLMSMYLRDNLRKQSVAGDDYTYADKIIAMRKHMDALAPTTDENELLLGADLHFMTAFGFFQKKEFKEAGEQFSVVIKNYPNSPSLADSLYYRGMTSMMQAKYQDAINDFQLYQSKYGGAEQYPASIFREAVCLLGLESTPQAEATFTRFIEQYPDDALVSEAYSMRGDIEAAKDGNDNPDTPDVNEYDPHTLDRALADYRKAIDKASLPMQSAYAAFQAAKVYKLEFKWQDIIDLMNYYLKRWNEQADVAQAVFWIGQSQIQLGQINEAIDAYLDAIERFGNDVEQVGVDKIVLELITIAEQHLSAQDREGLAVRLKLKLTTISDKSAVLQLRLRVAVARLRGAEATAELGAELLSMKDLSITTPVSLALMCDAAVNAENTENMALLYDYFTASFEESDQLWHAYRAKTVQLVADKKYDEVLVIIDTAQGLYGADTFMAWAQLTKANVLYAMKKYDEAQEAFNMIMGVSEWRGSTFAEAMYGMGRCSLAKEDYAKAHSFFQRTYLLFKNYDEGKWAADGYLAASACLIKLGRNADAVNTLAAMLEDPYVNTLPQAETARELKKKYGGA